MKRAIWWIRRDLRLTDNQALESALEQAESVIPVFILDPILLASKYASEKRLAFLLEGLRSLDADLHLRGSYLIVRRGDPLEELQRLWVESEAEAVFAEPDVSPYANRRDGNISRLLPLIWCGSPAVRVPGTVLKADGDPYTVFTPFSRAWKSLPGLQAGQTFRAPERIRTPAGIPTLSIPGEPSMAPTAPFSAGEAEARRRLARFVSRDGIYHYASGRDRQDLEGTSGLSPYLRFGMLSPRQVVSTALRAMELAPDAQAQKSAETWLNELIWRDFYIHILYHFPHVRRGNFRMQHVRWENNREHFAAWCAGQTGYPVVDAAMRQLVESGWMHNRSRMIVASFLTKDLLIDWRWGERFFMQHLMDGDPAANNGGWQWTAGTGTDAAPYFRIFNPLSQSLKHDPEGAYIRRWLPELRLVPAEYIHEPWKMPLDVQRASGCVIGQDYPSPVIDHAAAKERTLHAYQKP
jgi:deoxyribodipyrimidine photo-lyase